jgi:hypothetical protein
VGEGRIVTWLPEGVTQADVDEVLEVRRQYDDEQAHEARRGVGRRQDGGARSTEAEAPLPGEIPWMIEFEPSDDEFLRIGKLPRL